MGMTTGAQAAADAKKKLIEQQIIDKDIGVPRLAVDPFTPYFRTNNFIQRTWTKIAAMGKPTTIEGQTVRTFAFSETVTAGGSTTVSLYAVPQGKRFVVSTGVISCEASLIQKVSYVVNGIEFLRMNYDTFLSLIDSIIGAAVLIADDTLAIKLYNNDTADRVIEGAVWGVEEDVQT